MVLTNKDDVCYGFLPVMMVISFAISILGIAGSKILLLFLEQGSVMDWDIYSVIVLILIVASKITFFRTYLGDGFGAVNVIFKIVSVIFVLVNIASCFGVLIIGNSSMFSIVSIILTTILSSFLLIVRD